jgi:hypothetical protein
VALFVVAASLLGETQVGNAQSPYSSQWCAVYWADVAQARHALLLRKLRAAHDNNPLIGGYCVESPYHHPQPTQLLRHCP